jgi:hypothetical protein
VNYSDGLKAQYLDILERQRAHLQELLEVLRLRAADRMAGREQEPALIERTRALQRAAHITRRDMHLLQAAMIDEHLKSGTAFEGMTVPDFLPEGL